MGRDKRRGEAASTHSILILLIVEFSLSSPLSEWNKRFYRRCSEEFRLVQPRSEEGEEEEQGEAALRHVSERAEEITTALLHSR